MWRKSRKENTDFIQTIDSLFDTHTELIKTTTAEEADKALSRIMTTANDCFKAIQAKANFVQTTLQDEYELLEAKQKVELKKEISEYRQEMLDSIWSTKNECANKLTELEADVKKICVDFLHQSDSKSRELQQSVKHSIDDMIDKIPIRVFAIEEIAMRRIDMKAQEIQDRLVELFPVDKKSVWMDMTKNGLWSNKVEKKQ